MPLLFYSMQIIYSCHSDNYYIHIILITIFIAVTIFKVFNKSLNILSILLCHNDPIYNFFYYNKLTNLSVILFIAIDQFELFLVDQVATYQLDLFLIACDNTKPLQSSARNFGATEFINPKDYPNRTIQEVVLEKTDGGFDYTFECIGNVNTMVGLRCSCASAQCCQGLEDRVKAILSMLQRQEGTAHEAACITNACL